jgi:hypothetical protein
MKQEIIMVAKQQCLFLRRIKMTKLQKLLTTISVLGLLIVLGCSTFQNALVPCYIDPDAAIFADEPLTNIMPWTTILDAKRISTKMDFVHSVGRLEYNYLKSNLSSYLADAEQFKQTAFSPSGPIGLLVPAGLGLTIGTLALSKPDDKKKIKELEAKNGS